MIFHHSLDPIAFDLGFFEIRWYGIFYAISFLLAFFWLQNLVKNRLIDFTKKQIEDLVFAVILGVIVGGRVGYFLFYNFENLFSLELFKIWHGGMSFHGGLIGVLISVFWLAKKWRKSFLAISDVLVIPAAIGLFFGRIGNFMNGELFGRSTGGEWGVVFPRTDELPRFPSQLFEAAKNLIIAGILFLTFQKKPRTGILSFLFLTFYGSSRILVEFFWREPLDGFIFAIPRGAFFSLPVLAAGVLGLIFLNFKRARRM
ncbi:prolipoprotein diacylglyceryl transferase [Patescibacteria group bacterium]|nr:prolipoprotein diacylglyceryl transferase [Patescibacteria group bacterium]